MRVLFVEDDEMLGKATAEGLGLAYAVDWVRNAEDAGLAILNTPYAALVLDINLPAQSGLAFLDGLRRAGNDIPCLLLTARDAVRHRVEGLNAGADDYLVKPFDLDELQARVAALIRRSQGRSTSVLRHKDIVFDVAGKTLHKDGQPVALSGRELAIAEVLLSNIGRTVSKAQIESQIYNWNSEEIESNTVEVHISALRRKLGKDFVRTIRHVGYTVDK